MKKGILQASAVAKVGDCVDVTKSDFKFDVKVSFSTYNVLTVAFHLKSPFFPFLRL